MSRGFVLFAGLLAASAVTLPQTVSTESSKQKDPRLVRLQQFFRANACPVQRLAEEFISVADQHKLDWRLLPSISIVETGGGKAIRNNNLLGWASDRGKFTSVREGIQVVASRFAKSKLYRGKDANGILKVYNPRNGYAERVLAVMRTLGPSEFQLASN